MTLVDESFLEVRRFGAAEELIDALRLRNRHWRVPPPRGREPRVLGDWLFRGHGRDSWQLLPTAHREEAVLEYIPGARPGLKRTVREQRDAEFDALVHFMETADLQGLTVPDDSSLFRTEWARRVIEPLKEREWPPADIYSTLGLAQHFGVPTRFLDWSQSPLVAAYFAAREAAWLAHRSVVDPTTEELSIWALQPGWIYGLGRDRRFAKFPVRIVSVPAATNPNLKAQVGKFSLVLDDRERLDAPFVSRTLDAVLLDTFLSVPDESWEHLREDFPVLRRWTLPSTEAPKLLRLLSFEGITGSAVVPGYAGVVRALEEWRLWDAMP